MYNNKVIYTNVIAALIMGVHYYDVCFTALSIPCEVLMSQYSISIIATDNGTDESILNRNKTQGMRICTSDMLSLQNRCLLRSQMSKIELIFEL